MIHVFTLIFLKESNSKCHIALTSTLDPIMDPQVFFKMNINILFIILKTHVIHVLIFFKESECKCLIALTNNSDPIMDPQVYFKMYIMVKYTWWSIRGSRVFMRAMRHLLSDSLRKIRVNTCITCFSTIKKIHVELLRHALEEVPLEELQQAIESKHF